MKPEIAAQADIRIPELRQDLRLERRDAGPDGQSTWIIIDAAQHRYVALGEKAYQLLSIWRPGAPLSHLQSEFKATFDAVVSETEVTDLIEFLGQQHLTLDPPGGDWRYYSALADRARVSWFWWLVHNYLFIKIPLVRPEPFLDRAMPWVRPLYSRGFAAFVALCGASGLYLVSRQWDSFVTTFNYYFSFEGALAYASALIGVKALHELGHAFTARKYGCRVPSMGVCFLVLLPVLYTDVTDAWRLGSRRKRLAIGAAGVAVELTIACFATLAWAFLEDGPARSVAFTVATVGWIMSLAINLNPLMRFDGYYLFSDAIGVENLQARAFAYGRWRLREILFDLGHAPPERLPRSKERVLVAYAWATWIYRLVVFTGIALLVYHMAFKLLGIALFAIEIVYFILLPIWSELAAWRAEGRALLATRRARLTCAIAAILFVAAVTPWSTTITIPAVLESAELARIYPQRAGFVESVLVKPGDRVSAGDVIVRLSSIDLEHRLTVAKRKRTAINIRLARRGADAKDRRDSLTMEEALRSAISEIAGLELEASQLEIKSPLSGVVAELNADVHPGRTIARNEFIALVRGGADIVARGYVSERDGSRIEAGSQGRFIAEGIGFAPAPVTLKTIAEAGAQSIEIPELASTYGGPIAVRHATLENHRRQLAPIGAVYLVTAKAADHAQPGLAIRGVVSLSGQPRSFAGAALRRIAAVLIRESGI